MKRLLLANAPLDLGIFIIRVITGGIIIFFGLEVLNQEQINGYTEWLTDVGMPIPRIMAYVGKLSELVFGAFLILGFYTRLSCIPLMITMSVVTFLMLDGSITSSSFYLLLLFACFFFYGGGTVSLDHLRVEGKRM